MRRATLEIRENVSLAPYTTLAIGGPARCFIAARSPDEVVDALDLARENGLEVFILGGGSNLLVSDRGFDGVVIHIENKGLTERFEDGRVLIEVGAGEDWDEFVSFCVNKGYAGVECLSGIPGTVGGTPVQNVGAYGQDVSETIAAVRCIDRETSSIIEIDNAGCEFAYRKSVFNTTRRGRYVVVGVTFSLLPGGEPKVVYRDLTERFAGRAPGLADVRDAVLAIRRSKSMVIDESDPNSRSAGSFFKNPIIRSEHFLAIAERFPDVPRFPAEEGYVKIPAAWLIERAGFAKGFRRGRAGISCNHTLALVNLGGATAEEIVGLKDEIQAKVDREFQIELVPEPVMLGF